MISIHWFRQDLRLHDNPALAALKQLDQNVVPIFIFDTKHTKDFTPGEASCWWLAESLQALNDDLGGKLLFFEGDPIELIPLIMNDLQSEHISWNRCYEPWRIKRDKKIKKTLEDKGKEVHSCSGSLLWEPHTVLKDDQTPYRVFTPYYRRGCLKKDPPRGPIINDMPCFHQAKHAKALALSQASFAPTHTWTKKLSQQWQVGESHAMNKLEHFIDHGLADYKKGRDFPAAKKVSQLSPHIHWGEISPHQIWDAIQHQAPNSNTDHFLSELGWREFSYYLLYHFPTLPTDNFNPKFDAFTWHHRPKQLALWQQGLTGYPIVDAAMRELYQTGYMHNRMRMVTGSFLVKNLGIHWHHGERWFWDCLVDADLASNSAGWQWIAGCGADAAPYFRIFNPITQGEKFDADGSYTLHYVPELKNLDTKYLFCPWEAPLDVLAKAGITLGKTYPKPMIDIKTSREEALAAYAQIKTYKDAP